MTRQTTAHKVLVLFLLQDYWISLVLRAGYHEGADVKEEVHKIGCSKGGGYWPRHSSTESCARYTAIARPIEKMPHIGATGILRS